MHFFGKVLIAIAVNLLGLLAADHIVQGFRFTGTFETLVLVAVIFTALNYLLRPILKLILGPIIILTLGLGTFVVNALILKLLDFLSPALSIQGILALLWGTLIVSLINFVFHFATRK